MTLGSLAIAVAALQLSCGVPRPVTTPPSPARQCPSAVTPLAPLDATSILFVRPHALFSDPQVGPILTHSFDDASEAALVRRAVRDGFDVRTLDRAVIAWSPRSTAYYVAGPLDAARVSDHLWERLLLPRHRTREDSFERVEGTIGHHLVGLLLDGTCATAAYVEGPDTRLLDRLILANTQRDPDALVSWHAQQLPDGVGTQVDTALIRQVREIDVNVGRVASGLTVNLQLTGAFAPESTERVRAALRAIVTAPIGDLSGAVQWLDPDHAVQNPQPDRIVVEVIVPWRAATALAAALRGDTQTESHPEKSTGHNL